MDYWPRIVTSAATDKDITDWDITDWDIADSETKASFEITRLFQITLHRSIYT